MPWPLIGFSRLNLPIKAKFHKKSCGWIPCSCKAKIEAEQIHKKWRSLELWICNFLKNYLITSTICWSEKTAFIVFLKKSKVRIALRYMLFKLYSKVSWPGWNKRAGNLEINKEKCYKISRGTQTKREIFDLLKLLCKSQLKLMIFYSCLPKIAIFQRTYFRYNRFKQSWSKNLQKLPLWFQRGSF